VWLLASATGSGLTAETVISGRVTTPVGGAGASPADAASACAQGELSARHRIHKAQATLEVPSRLPMSCCCEPDTFGAPPFGGISLGTPWTPRPSAGAPRDRRPVREREYFTEERDGMCYCSSYNHREGK
jgi:hypothetical protein